MSFGREYTAAVEAKQVAQQEAQRAQFIVEKAKQERQEKIVRAEGEAEAATMISSSTLTHTHTHTHTHKHLLGSSYKFSGNPAKKFVTDIKLILIMAINFP